MPSSTFDVSWLQVQMQWLPGSHRSGGRWVKDIVLDWLTVVFDDFFPPACQWHPSFVGLAVQCWRELEAIFNDLE